MLFQFYEVLKNLDIEGIKDLYLNKVVPEIQEWNYMIDKNVKKNGIRELIFESLTYLRLFSWKVLKVSIRLYFLKQKKILDSWVEFWNFFLVEV